jgi:hypothetical protein
VISRRLRRRQALPATAQAFNPQPDPPGVVRIGVNGH